MTIQKQVSLKPYNSFRVDVSAKYFTEITDKKQLSEIFGTHKFDKFLVIGKGCNILFTEDYDGLILLMRNKGIECIEETDEAQILDVQAGENWDDFVRYCVDNRLYGAENLSLIPGTVGAAPVQNIGAYGAEVKDIIESVEVYDVNLQKFRRFTNIQCNFDYRSSLFKYPENKQRYIISSIRFKLKKQAGFKLDYGNLKMELEKYDTVNLQTVRQAVIAIRQSKLPDVEEVPNVGSFFKNPIVSQHSYENLKQEYPQLVAYPVNDDDEQVKLAAGQLIDLCGLKGSQKGNVAVHDKQALVIISDGKASGSEILEFADNIRQKVLQKFGIKISPEVNII